MVKAGLGSLENNATDRSVEEADPQEEILPFWMPGGSQESQLCLNTTG